MLHKVSRDGASRRDSASIRGCCHDAPCPCSTRWSRVGYRPGDDDATGPWPAVQGAAARGIPRWPDSASGCESESSARARRHAACGSGCGRFRTLLVSVRGRRSARWAEHEHPGPERSARGAEPLWAGGRADLSGVAYDL